MRYGKVKVEYDLGEGGPEVRCWYVGTLGGAPLPTVRADVFFAVSLGPVLLWALSHAVVSCESLWNRG